MAKLHSYFLKFHDNIRMGTYDEEQTLRDKRDVLLSNLKDNLDDDAPLFSSFSQGSYALGTGIKPVDGNYDIDVGVIFEAEPDDYDPVTLKKMVRDALTRSNRQVVIRRPCVTVNYMKNGAVDYHVDLAIYTQGSDGNLHLAVGKEFSNGDSCKWEPQDPKGLQNTIINKHSDESRLQFRRAVRYLKYWRQHNFDHGRLISIALTVAAYNWFSPNKSWWDGKYDDLAAMDNLVSTMLDNWRYVTNAEGDLVKRLVVTLPVEPGTDLLAKMTDKQMADFEEKLKLLQTALRDAQDETDEVVACESMADIFSDAFPVPAADETTSAKVKRSVTGTGNSA